MSQRGVLRDRGEHGYAWWCPGCECYHGTKGWDFNGNFEKPTFSPSFLVRSGCKLSDHKPGDPCWCTFNAEDRNEHWKNRYECTVCHTFVIDGMIQYLNDTTHHLSGQTVPLTEMPHE